MKTAFSRLVVSLLSLLTVVVALATSLGKLLVTVVGLLTAALERAVEAIKSRRSGRSIEALKEAPEAPEAPRANLRVLPGQSSKRDELTRALTGLKFPTPAVKRFVTALTEDDMKQDIRDLIKAGLKEMAA